MRDRKIYDFSKYKDGLHLLSLTKEEEERLIEVVECSLETAKELEDHELLNRRETLQAYIKMHSEMLKTECYELYYVLGSMEDNYRYIIKECRENRV